MYERKVVKSAAAAVLALCLAQPAFADPDDKAQKDAEHDSWLSWIQENHGTELNHIWRCMIDHWFDGESCPVE